MVDMFELLGRSVSVRECGRQQERLTTTLSNETYQFIRSWGPREYMPGYAVNGAVTTWPFNPAINPGWDYPPKGLKLNHFKNPSQKIWYGDGGAATNRYIDPYPHTLTRSYLIPPVETSAVKLGRSWTMCTIGDHVPRMLSGRHGNDWKKPRGNVVFFDGHAETVFCMDVWADI